MNKKDYSKEIKIAIKAAKEAAKALLKDKNKISISNITNKRDTKLKADIASEEVIKEIIKSDSDYQILAEESGKSSNDMGNIFWVVDPLDGTANYSRDIPICCISIGLVANLQPLFGVIYDFNNDDMYIGNKHKEICTLNNDQIYVSNIKEKRDGILVTGLPVNSNFSDSSLQKVIDDMQAWKKIRMIGSAAMASCYVASGKAEMYKEKGVYLWDIVAGAAIVESAGGIANISNIRDNFQVDVIFSNSLIKD